MTHVLVLDVFQKLQLAVRSLAKDWRAEGLHDLLYRNRGPCELIFRGTVVDVSMETCVPTSEHTIQAQRHLRTAAA